jgi:hypothetical protein
MSANRAAILLGLMCAEVTSIRRKSGPVKNSQHKAETTRSRVESGTGSCVSFPNQQWKKMGRRWVLSRAVEESKG